MEGIVIPGLPAEYGHIITIVVGLLSSWLVGPLTALAKKAGHTEGVATVTVSAALSLMVGLGYAAINAASGGAFSVVQAVVIAAVAFAKANGDYVNRVNANKKANKEAPPVVTQPVVIKEGPPAGVPLGPEHFGPSFDDVPLDPTPAASKPPTLRVD